MSEKIIKLQCTIPKDIELSQELKQKLLDFQIKAEEILPKGIEIEYISENNL